MNSMGPRVVHLATSRLGGAGIAAWRIHEALLEAGVQSYFLTQGSGDHVGAHLVQRTASQRGMQKTSTLLNRALSRPDSILFAPLSHGVVRLRDIEQFSPDVVHVHNWYNFFDWSLAPMLAARGIRIVATLHDERLLTGGCHYTLDCPDATRICASCSQSRLRQLSTTRQRRSLLREHLATSRARLVTPSSWLRQRALDLGVGPTNECEVIPNCVSRSLLNEPTRPVVRGDRVTVGIVVGKSPSLIQGALDKVARMLGPERSAEVDILTAGIGPSPQWQLGQLRDVGRIDSDKDRAAFWDRVDVGLFATRSDNFPNTLLEGMSRGIPQVVPEIGGASEAVTATGGGLVRSASPQALAEGLARMINDPELRRATGAAARRGVLDRYHPDVIARRYVSAYDVGQEPL